MNKKINMTARQVRTFEKLEAAFEECEIEGIVLVNYCGTFHGLNGSVVESADSEGTNNPGNHSTRNLPWPFFSPDFNVIWDCAVEITLKANPTSED